MVLEFVRRFSQIVYSSLIVTFYVRFINSMPMVFAFRIVDCFFCMGPKVLFQVGLVNCHFVPECHLLNTGYRLGQLFNYLTNHFC
jgi:hypothetical protein